MRTMIPLRVAGITSNCLFIVFGFFGAVYPTLVLHAALLPLNTLRLYQMLQSDREGARGGARQPVDGMAQAVHEQARLPCK
jgi:hypothetical protein